MNKEVTVADLERSIAIAVAAHEGQKDKGGSPYILHPLRVMMSLRTEEEMIVGVLHDVIEDVLVRVTTGRCSSRRVFRSGYRGIEISD